MIAELVFCFCPTFGDPILGEWIPNEPLELTEVHPGICTSNETYWINRIPTFELYPYKPCQIEIEVPQSPAPHEEPPAPVPEINSGLLVSLGLILIWRLRHV